MDAAGPELLAGGRCGRPGRPPRSPSGRFHVAFSSSFTSLISLLLLRQPQHPVALSRVQADGMTVFYHLRRSHLRRRNPLQGPAAAATLRALQTMCVS